MSRIALGSEFLFASADVDPIGTAGFSAAEVKAIVEDNPRELFHYCRVDDEVAYLCISMKNILNQSVDLVARPRE
ncbi:MAG: hypothetical protein J2P56_06250 [Verrucomicrobia bacterium]|nr:hypothetical protein [Verrucomicrobiota bacterium]